MSTRCAVARSRSVTENQLHSHAVAAEDVVELGLVMALALREALHHQHAGQTKRPTRIFTGSRCADSHRPWGHMAAADLVARLGVDDRDRRVEDDTFAEHGTPTDP